MTWTTLGALCFGAVIGWYLYFINRYRKGDVSIGDITTVIGAIGGAAVISLFEPATSAFGAYGVGLAVGFFAYFASLVILVRNSDGAFTSTWFLDGRRADPPPGWGYGTGGGQPDQRPMMVPLSQQQSPTFYGTPPGAIQNFYLGSGPGPVEATAAAPASRPRPAASLPSAGDRVVDACHSVWTSGNGGSHEFVTEVARLLGIKLTGSADDIIDQIQSAPWVRLDGGAAARDAARAGKFVVAGVRSKDSDPARADGRVAVIVPEATDAASRAPAGYWGGPYELDGEGSPIIARFRAEDEAAIVYGAHPL